MFNFINDPNREKLNGVISDLLTEMEGMDSTTENFGGIIDNLVKLVKLKNDTLKTESDINIEDQKLTLDQSKIDSEQEKIRLEGDKQEFEEKKFEFEKEKHASWRPSPDAIIGAAAGVLGIVAILHYEKIGIVTSKALGFVGRSMK